MNLGIILETNDPERVWNANTALDADNLRPRAAMQDCL